MADSRIIGDVDDIGDMDDLGDLIGDDDLGDLISGDDEMGARKRRIKRLAKRHGLVAMPRSRAQVLASAAAQASQAQQVQQQAQLLSADVTGFPRSAGAFVADGGQRELYLPFSTAPAIGAAVGQVATLSAVVQRAIMFKRLILSVVDGTTRADDLITCTVTNFLIGVQPVFNASGVAPAEAFSSRAVGNRLLTPVARVGTTVTVGIQRVALGANAGVVSGYLVGVSADT